MIVSPRLLNYVEFFNYTCLLIGLVGLVSNAFMFVIFSHRSVIHHHHSMSTYFRAMALVNFYISINCAEISIQQKFGFKIFTYSSITCRILMFTVYVSGPTSAWFQVAAGIDHFLKIFYPNRFNFIRYPSSSLFVVCIIVVYNIAFYFNLLIDLRLVEYPAIFNNMISEECLVDDSSPTQILDLINSSVAPFVLMMATSILTLVGLIKSRNRVKLSTTRNPTRDVKFGVTLIVINFVFFIFVIPNPLFNLIVVNWWSFIDPETNFRLNILFIICYYLFYSTTFFVQLVVNNIVKNQFVKLLRLDRLIRCPKFDYFKKKN